MCLTVVYQGEQKKKAIARLPDEFWGWRYCKKKFGKYYPLFHSRSVFFRTGINTAVERRVCTDNVDYNSGFHFFLSKKDVNAWFVESHVSSICSVFFRAGINEDKRMRCRIKKEHITDIGKQGDALCIVVSQAHYPKYCK